MKIICMGVCGSGKTTMAERLARYLQSEPVIEADLFHTLEMKEKMRSGVPLTDEDRWPWLDRMNQAMRESKKPYTVVTCSALKRVYRERLVKNLEDSVCFLFLDAPREVIQRRLTARTHEYMPTSLLGSQFDTLERPEGEGAVITISVDGSEEETFEAIKAALSPLMDRSIVC